MQLVCDALSSAGIWLCEGHEPRRRLRPLVRAALARVPLRSRAALAFTLSFSAAELRPLVESPRELGLLLRCAARSRGWAGGTPPDPATCYIQYILSLRPAERRSWPRGDCSRPACGSCRGTGTSAPFRAHRSWSSQSRESKRESVTSTRATLAHRHRHA